MRVSFPIKIGTMMITQVGGVTRKDRVEGYFVSKDGIFVILTLDANLNCARTSRPIPLDEFKAKWAKAKD